MEESSDADLFFAQQVITNACATQAILSVVFNAPGLDLGNHLQDLKARPGKARTLVQLPGCRLPISRGSRFALAGLHGGVHAGGEGAGHQQRGGDPPGPQLLPAARPFRS